MATTSRKDIDAEMAAWLAECGLSRAEAQDADRLADLWLANQDAMAVKDKRPPIGDAASERLNAALRGIGY